MKRFAIVFVGALAIAPAQAEDDTSRPSWSEFAPLLDNLRGLMEGWAQDALPLMEDLADKMSDLNAYEAPEVLPNGDIIIRRKSEPTPAPKSDPQPNADGSIDL